MAFIKTYTGKYVDIENFTADDVYEEDIIHSLSYLCRFNGHVSQFYSVAEHSINVAKLIFSETTDNRLFMAALIHDASEAYITDIPRPQKHLVPQFVEIDKHVQKTIDDVFGVGDLSEEEQRLIKEADNAMLRLELSRLMDYDGDIVNSINITKDFNMSDINFDREWHPAAIKKMFEAAFNGVVLL